ncbi:hypothetical protein [Mesorhizobium sp. B2-7-1]|uniref:hypothetical protein n=1 Tax=Mesorhizobium sp. B2-7-1 TaxID=2589909 RepID=UPI0011295EBA|nr:hypothetical protein [Mesorhizobium sp. B2-7-1]TPJ72699.1 hypothetical protein FJ471_06400 [Mesorhizobium sp. B2-7-1]
MFKLTIDNSPDLIFLRRLAPPNSPSPTTSFPAAENSPLPFTSLDHRFAKRLNDAREIRDSSSAIEAIISQL